MNIAYLQSMATSPAATGGHVHVSRLAEQLFARGHKLYSNLQRESHRFVRLSPAEFKTRGGEIDVFYVRIHGSTWNDEFTLIREANVNAPCVWEVNAPLEEMRRTRNVSERDLARGNRRRRDLARMVDGAVCVSEEMEAYAREELGIGRTVVIPNGSDPERFSPALRRRGFYGDHPFVLLWSGSPRYPWQGLRLIEEAARRLRGIDPRILVAVTAHGESEGNLRRLGEVPYGEMPVLMASADAGLCVYEPVDFYKSFFFSPLKLYDYMASGLPVIGSAAGQVGRVVTSLRNGLLVDGTVEDLVEKILALEKDRAGAEEMGRRGRRAVEDTYNWASVAARTEAFLRECAGVHRAEPRHRAPGGPFRPWRSLQKRLVLDVLPWGGEWLRRLKRLVTGRG